MKTNRWIRKYLTDTNHWHSVEAFEKQGVCADHISIYETRYRMDQPGTFIVSHRCYDPECEGQPLSQQYWASEFAIRDSIGNPTDLGRKMGIKCRDRRILVDSPKGQAIQEFLKRMAWLEACKLTKDRTQILDETGYSIHRKLQSAKVA